MIRLRSCVLTHLLSSPATYPSKYPVSCLHRLLSAAAPRILPNPSFAVEDYHIGTCGLTQAQAVKASTRLSHLKSPTKPDAVLAGLGLSGTDIATLVAKDPKFLCTGMDKTLSPIIAGLNSLGLSHSEIAPFVSLAPGSFRRASIVAKVQYYMLLFGSYENLLRAIKCGPHLLSSDLENRVKPTIAFLRECRLSACDIAKLCITKPRMLTTNLESVQMMVACAEGLGVPRGSGTFRHMLHAVASLSEENTAVKVEYMKNMFRWTDAEVGIAVCKAPLLLVRSKDTLQSKSEFLISEVELEPAYIAHRPAMITYSLEGRLRPRYYVMKFLKENGLIDRDRSYFAAVTVTEKVFVALVEGKCLLDSYLREPRAGYEKVCWLSAVCCCMSVSCWVGSC